MINSYKEYREYLDADERSMGLYGKSYISKNINLIYRYQKALRRHEYMHNCKKKIWQKPIVILAAMRHRQLGLKCGYTIPINVFEKGLSIAHLGTIVVSSGAQVGENCRIHVCTNIGVAAGCSDGAPQIGNNVYIGPGAKLYGRITIANDIAIGANSVVNKDFINPGVSIAGVPAKEINNKGSKGLL